MQAHLPLRPGAHLLLLPSPGAALQGGLQEMSLHTPGGGDGAHGLRELLLPPLLSLQSFCFVFHSKNSI